MNINFMSYKVYRTITSKRIFFSISNTDVYITTLHYSFTNVRKLQLEAKLQQDVLLHIEDRFK